MFPVRALAVAVAVAVALPAAAQPAPPPLPADPIAAIDGVWHDQRRKVDVTIRNGVVTITNFETGFNFGVLPYREGAVIARLKSGKDERGSYRYAGECVTGGYGGPGQQWVMADCGSFGPLLKPVVSGGKGTFRFGVGGLELYRSDIMTAEARAARK